MSHVCVWTGRDLLLAWSALIAVPGYGGLERSANEASARTSQTRAALVWNKEVLLGATQPLPDFLGHNTDPSQ